MSEKPKPNLIRLKVHDVFNNGDLSLTNLGSSINYIFQESSFLKESPPKGRQPRTPQREEEIRKGISAMFTQVSSSLGIPDDEALIPELNSRFYSLVNERQEEMMKQFRSSFPRRIEERRIEEPAETVLMENVPAEVAK